MNHTRNIASHLSPGITMTIIAKKTAKKSTSSSQRALTEVLMLNSFYLRPL
jgi:hypothetical protein